MLKPLITIVESMVREHRQLLEAGQRKKDVLIKGDMPALNELVKEEAAMVHRIERMENERMGMGRLLALRLSISVEELTAERLEQAAATPEEAVQMRELTSELRQVLGELQWQNSMNKQLLEASLQYIQTNIEMLTESPTVPTYGNNGQSHAAYQTVKTSLFDSKA